MYQGRTWRKLGFQTVAEYMFRRHDRNHRLKVQQDMDSLLSGSQMEVEGKHIETMTTTQWVVFY